MKLMHYVLWLVGLLLGLGILASYLMVYIPRWLPMQETAVLLNGMSAPLIRFQLAVQTLLMFFIPAWVVFRMMQRDKVVFDDSPCKTYWQTGKGAIFAMLLALLLLPIVSFLGAWNASWPLPDWALMMEQQAKLMTDFVLEDASIKALVVNLIVCAALPAIAEEVFFRGVLQNVFERTLRNPHWAILVSAAIFSFFHFQFAGFIPRMFLGILMGYLYYFSRSLWLPIIAHFTNNAVAVIAYSMITRYGCCGYTPAVFDRFLEQFGILHILSILAVAGILYVSICREIRCRKTT